MVRLRLAFAVISSGLLLAQAAVAGINLVGAETTNVSPKPEYMAAGDLDNDGRTDIVVVSPSSKDVSTYLAADTPSHFSPARVVHFGNTLRGVALGDLNRDNRLDVVIADQAAQGVWILLGKGDGTYQDPYLITVPNSRNPYAVAIADWDKSGGPDLAVADSRVSKVFILLNDNATQPRFRRGGDFVSGDQPQDIRAVDMNGDGTPDIVTFNLGGPRVKDLGVVLWKRVVQGFPEFDTPQKYTIGENPSSLVVADFNNDGNADFAMLNRPAGGTGNSDLDVLLSRGDGVLLPPTSLSIGCPFFTGGAPCRARTMVAGDFDGNGQMDLAITVTDPRRSRNSASASSDAMQAFGGRGDGGFVPGPVFSIQKTPESMAAAELSGDGKLDIVIANERTLNLQAFVNVSSPGGTSNGESCQTGDECLSSRCTNGVCCAAQCDLNEVCNIPGREGTCVPQSTGVSEPCTVADDCTENGDFCVDTGQGLCFPQFNDQTESCMQAKDCSNSGAECTTSVCCDMQCMGGRCDLAGFEGRCIPGILDGQPCSGDDSECSSGHCSPNLVCCREACTNGFCDEFGICKNLGGPGQSCTDDSQCNSNICDSFSLICCNKRCNEATEQCNADGTCGPLNPTPMVTATPVQGTPTATATVRLTPGGNGEECSVGTECSSTFCVNDVCCAEVTCGGDAHCEKGTGVCASGGTPTASPTTTATVAPTRLPITPTVNPCSPNPCNGKKCIVGENGGAQCIITSSSGGCSTGGDGGSDSNLLIAAMLPAALWFGRRRQLQRAVVKRRR